MKKCKVEFLQSRTYVIDVMAKDERGAEKKARKDLAHYMAYNIQHYYQTGEDDLIVKMVHDVTNTDDPFDAKK